MKWISKIPILSIKLTEKIIFIGISGHMLHFIHADGYMFLLAVDPVFEGEFLLNSIWRLSDNFYKPNIESFSHHLCHFMRKNYIPVLFEGGIL